MRVGSCGLLAIRVLILMILNMNIYPRSYRRKTFQTPDLFQYFKILIIVYGSILIKKHIAPQKLSLSQGHIHFVTNRPTWFSGGLILIKSQSMIVSNLLNSRRSHWKIR